MSIADREDPQVSSVTEGDRALELFTNRHAFRQLFVERLNEDPLPEQIMFFHGDGGNGKSLLLKHLQANCCKRLLNPERWRQLRAMPDAEFTQAIAAMDSWDDCCPVPSALLDFDLKQEDASQVQQSFDGLLLLRRRLAESAACYHYRLKFRRFDFACIWLLFKNGESPEKIKAFFPVEKALELGNISLDTFFDSLSKVVPNFAKAVPDLVSGIPIAGGLAKAAISAVRPNWTQELMVWKSRFGIERDELDRIVTKEVNSDLKEYLPVLLARDLNDCFSQENAPDRLVLFFDTHEAFWGRNNRWEQVSREAYFKQDRWLRILLRNLKFSKGIIVVVAGRESPRWPETPRTRPEEEKSDIPDRYLYLKSVENFSPSDALAYLQQPGIGLQDPELCQSLIAYASEKPGEVHPYYLGLCADIVLQAAAAGQSLRAADFATVPAVSDLVERLLTYVNQPVRYALYALSACRSFEFKLYRELGGALGFSALKPDFDLITNFSFVKRAASGNQDGFSLHGILRRQFSLAEDSEIGQTIQRAHEFLEQHYRNSDLVESIYHANRLEPSRGVKDWFSAFDQALAQARYQDCERLLTLRGDLLVSSDFELGWLSQTEGDYYQRLAKYREADREYQESIAAYDSALNRAPDDINALNNKGTALQRRGALQAQLAQHTDALTSYTQAIAAYECVFKRAPHNINALN